ncbi:hypothetical protein [Pallidibacillus thermolactis]|jgi:hypothetical protein|nr:hypothetical protein [Pallidibacillus thermolactis]MCU9601930.1 hypothetical protein [Pallidibacillus thermolactis subsp. kokeshiiformis]
MLIALFSWFGTIFVSLLVGSFLCYRIEKSGVKRWGATGKLFKG